MSAARLITASQRPRLLRLLSAAFFLLAGALACAAADPNTELEGPPSTEASQSELAGNQFRRVYVPAERPDAWPVDQERYLPIERAELANLLRQPATTTARVTAITLEGKIDQAGDLVGQGELHVTTAGSGTAFVPWPNQSLRITKARWLGPEPQPALLGLWMPGPGGGDLYGLAVPKSGRVAFDFEACGAADDLTRFSIPLPSSIDRRLLLTLPGDVEPVSATALIEREESQPQGSERKQSVRWLIRPPAGQDLVFAVPAATTTGSATGSLGQSSPVSLSTMSEVKLTREGAKIQTTLQLRSSSPLPRTLLIETPTSLALMRAEVDGSQVAWRHPTNGGAKNSIEIPLTVRKEPHQVEIVFSAWSQTPERGDWQAPLFQAPGAVWEEGAMRVRVDPELSVIDLPHLEDAILAPVQSIENTNEREFAVQFLTSTPTIELSLAPVEKRLVLIIDQSCELSDTEILSQFALTVTKNLTANAQTLRAVVGPEWLIESVESEPAGLVRDWFLVEPGVNELSKKPRPARNWGRQHLVLQIAAQASTQGGEAKPLASSNSSDSSKAPPLPSVRIACRRLMPPGGAIALSALAPLQVVGAEINENTLHVNAARPYELKLRGANRNPSDDVNATRTAEGWTLNLTRGMAGGWATGDGGRDDGSTGIWGRGATVELTQQPLQFDGDIETSLQPTRQGWKYRTELRIESPSSRVEPILCYFHPPLSGDSSPLPKWLDGATGAPLDAVRLSPKNPSTGELSPANQPATYPSEAHDEGEWWSVRPPSGAGSKATLIVETLLGDSDELPIPLVSFPKAQRQTGRIALHGLAGSATHVRHEGLTALQALHSGELAYSYSPDDFRTPRPNPQLSIKATANDQIVSGRATPLRLASLESVWTPDGSTLHTASYEAVAGLDQFRFSLPKEIDLVGVSNAQGLPLRITETLSNTGQPLADYRVDALANPATSKIEGEAISDAAPAPPDDSREAFPRHSWRRGSRILITYRAPAGRSHLEATPFLPQCEATQDSWEWRLLAPQGWRPATGSYASRDWRQRLFGILAQPAGHQPFNPFRSSDWGSVTQKATQIVAEPRSTAGAAFNRLRNRSGANLAAAPAQIPSLGGWEAYRFSGAYSPPPAVRFVQESRQQAWLLALQTAVMALAAWRLCSGVGSQDSGRRDLQRRGSWGRAEILLLLVAMLVALVVPAAYSRVASAIWFGLVLAWPCRWLVVGLTRLSSSFQDSSSGTRSISGTSGPLASHGNVDVSPVLWLLALTGSLTCLSATDCVADSPPQSSVVPSNETIQEVLIPVDESGAEIGDKHYVRESFLSGLLTQQRKQHRPGPAEVLVEEVRHSGELLSDRPDAPVQAGRWTTTLRLRSLRRGAVVWLPLQQGAAVWPNTVSVDGVPAVLTWDNPAEASFVIPEPGPCVVSFSFEPVIVVSDGESCVQLPRLMAPGSLLNVRYPLSLKDIRIPFAESVNAAQPGELRAILGKNPQLLVCWTETAPTEAGDSQPVDMLQRIQLSPSGVRMQVQLMGNSPSQPLQIVTPVGWRLAEERVARPTSDSDAESVAESQPAMGDPSNGIATYVANRMSPLGMLQVPAVKAPGANIRRRLAAVVVDDQLLCQAVDPSQGLPLETAEFASQWNTNAQRVTKDPNSLAGESGNSGAIATESTSSEVLPAKTPGVEKATLAVELNDDDWRLRVTPVASSAVQEPRLEMALGAKQTRYRLRLTELKSYGPMITVALPNGFNVDRVSTGPRDESRDVHWSHPQPARLVIFKPARLPPGSWLEVTGHGPRAGKTLPRLAISAGAASIPTMDVRVYRAEGVLTRIDTPADNSTAESLTPPKSWRVRPVASLRLNPSLPAPGLQIMENKPRFEATSLSSYSRLNRTTTFAWSAKLQVKQGILGELFLTAPSSLSRQDLQVLSPAGATLLKDNLAAPTWTLRLANPAATGDELRIDLRVRTDSPSQPSLKDPESGSTPAPLLELPQAIATQDFVAVPAPTAQQIEPPVRWSVRDMKRVHAPQGATALLPMPGKWRVFELDARSHGEDGEIARVFWTSDKQSPGRIRVTMADYQLQDHRQVESVLAAQFLVEPRGVAHCQLQLGEGDHLQALTIDGAPTKCVQKSPGLWEIELRESLAPQLVEAVVVGASPASFITPPQIVSEEGRSIPAQVSVWAVHTDAFMSVTPPPGGRIATHGVTKVVRLRALTQAALEQVAPSPEWVSAWRGRVENALHDVEASYNVDETSPISAEDNDELDRQDRESQNAPITLIREARQWLAGVGRRQGPAPPSESPGVGSDARSVDGKEPEAASDGDEGQWTYLIQTPVNHSASTPQGPHITANLTAVSKLRLLLVLTTILAIVALYRTSDSVDFPALAYEYRHALVAIGGVAWWLFLTPSFVGFLLLVAAAVGQLSLLWKEAQPASP